MREDIKLSSFLEDAETARKRCDLDVRLRRLRDATRSLVRALDVDESKPLDSTWLAELQIGFGLPPDDRVLYTEGELATALSSFEAFHRIEVGSATVEQLQRSSAKIGGWLRATADMLASKAVNAATMVQTAARGRAAVKARALLAARASAAFEAAEALALAEAEAAKVKAECEDEEGDEDEDDDFDPFSTFDD